MSKLLLFMMVGVSIAASVLGCNKPTGENNTTATENYFPLQFGNTWVYGVSIADSIYTHYNCIVDTIQLEGELYYKFDRYGFGGETLVRMDENNQLLRRLNRQDHIWYKFSAAAGDTWPAPGIGHLELVSRNETVTVPAGTFSNCLQIHYYFGGPDNDWDEWFAVGVGCVKRVLYGIDVISYELQNFSID